MNLESLIDCLKCADTSGAESFETLTTLLERLVALLRRCQASTEGYAENAWTWKLEHNTKLVDLEYRIIQLEDALGTREKEVATGSSVAAPPPKEHYRIVKRPLPILDKWTHEGDKVFHLRRKDENSGWAVDPACGCDYCTGKYKRPKILGFKPRPKIEVPNPDVIELD